MVIGRAIISDLAVGAAAARAFSLMMIVGGVAPVVAPVLGSVLVGPLGWRGVMWVVFGIVAAMFVGVVTVVRETHTRDRRASARFDRDRSPTVLRALASRVYIGNALAFAFAFATMMAYISASPFIYQVMIGFSEVQYGIAFAVNALGLAAMSAVSARLAATRSIRVLAGTGLALCLAATVTIVVVVASGAPSWFLAVPLWVAVSSLGLVFGNATALALSAVTRAAGSASAIRSRCTGVPTGRDRRRTHRRATGRRDVRGPARSRVCPSCLAEDTYDGTAESRPAHRRDFGLSADQRNDVTRASTFKAPNAISISASSRVVVDNSARTSISPALDVADDRSELSWKPGRLAALTTTARTSTSASAPHTTSTR
jgi:MFS family permease